MLNLKDFDSETTNGVVELLGIPFIRFCPITSTHVEKWESDLMTRFSDLLEKEHELISFESIQELRSNGVTLRFIVHGSDNPTNLLKT